MTVDPRHCALAGLALGLALSPLAGSLDPGPGIALLALGALALAALRSDPSRRLSWLAGLAALACAAGLLLGTARLEAIDGGAYRGPVGRPAVATGFVAAVPRRRYGEVTVELETAGGRLLLVAREPVGELAVGAELRAEGTLAEPDPFGAPLLRRHGIAQTLAARRVELTGRHRGGVAGALDGVRTRAESALERGMREQEAALARGFVLGQDDRIEPETADEFKDSGLAHLLAVSGQNVVLLALLAMPLLGLAGLTLRARLVCVLVLIAVYVPVAGAGPSIQRAGAMGAAGIVAALAGRPSSRVYAVLLAVAVTLALNPRASGEIGWQLSFAAVIGIFLWTGRLAALLGPRPGRAAPGREAEEAALFKKALAEGVAMSIAATLATAPLMAHHFERVSIAALPANLLALPAVAPAMWLGMLSGAAGQIPALGWAPGPLNAINELLLAYIAQVAHWFAAPGWAVVSLRLGGAIALAGAYAALLAAVWLALRAAERRRGLAVAGDGRGRPGRRRALAVALAAGLALALLPGLGSGSGGVAGRSAGALRISALDVGQGDAILLEPPDGDPVLVDGGPPGAGLTEQLSDHGIDRLAAALVTHDQSDHAGGIHELLGRMPVGSLAYARLGNELLGDGGRGRCPGAANRRGR